LSAISCTRSEQLDHERVHALEALLHARAFFADLEDLLLGFIQDLGDLPALRIERGGGDFVARGHQFAQDGAFANDLGVAPDVGRAGHVLRQRVQVGQTTGLIGLAQVLQVFKHRDHVGRLAGVDQRGDGGIGQTVFVAVKVGIVDQVGHAVPGMVVKQQATQHTGFGLDGMRGNTQLGNLPVGTEIDLVKSGIKRRKGAGECG